MFFSINLLLRHYNLLSFNYITIMLSFLYLKHKNIKKVNENIFFPSKFKDSPNLPMDPRVKLLTDNTVKKILNDTLKCPEKSVLLIFLVTEKYVIKDLIPQFWKQVNSKYCHGARKYPSTSGHLTARREYSFGTEPRIKHKPWLRNLQKNWTPKVPIKNGAVQCCSHLHSNYYLQAGRTKHCFYSC